MGIFKHFLEKITFRNGALRSVGRKFNVELVLRQRTMGGNSGEAYILVVKEDSR